MQIETKKSQGKYTIIKHSKYNYTQLHIFTSMQQGETFKQRRVTRGPVLEQSLTANQGSQAEEL